MGILADITGDPNIELGDPLPDDDIIDHIMKEMDRLKARIHALETVKDNE